MKGSGFPVRIPAIELVEIGSGGGSMARLDALGRLLVGPQSAGSVPGPVCYGRGGTVPTVTDADVVLGKIDPSRFSGGVGLDVAGAEAAIGRDIGRGLGLDVDLAAFAIGEIVDENMAGAARVHAIESGKAVAARTMIAFGGAAPIHAARVALKLGVSTVIIPANAGVGSAVGFLAAGLAFEQARSLYMTLGAFDAQRVNPVLADMASGARTLLGGDAHAYDEARTAYMRYRGQGHEITVSLPARPLGDGAADDLRTAFEARYRELFGRIIPDQPIELLTWTVRVERREADQPAAATAESLPPGDPSKTPRTLPVFDPVAGARLAYAVYDRATLAPGRTLVGPCLITEAQTTTVAPSGFGVAVAADGALVLTRSIEPTLDVYS